MKHLILIIIIALLNSCGDKIYNTTVVEQSQGAKIKLIEGSITGYPSQTIAIPISTFNPDNQYIVSSVKIWKHRKDNWSNEAGDSSWVVYSDTTYVGSYTAMDAYRIESDTSISVVKLDRMTDHSACMFSMYVIESDTLSR